VINYLFDKASIEWYYRWIKDKTTMSILHHDRSVIDHVAKTDWEHKNFLKKNDRLRQSLLM